MINDKDQQIADLKARLALAREWIAANDRPCSREEILAALEGPK